MHRGVAGSGRRGGVALVEERGDLPVGREPLGDLGRRRSRPAAGRENDQRERRNEARGFGEGNSHLAMELSGHAPPPLPGIDGGHEDSTSTPRRSNSIRGSPRASSARATSSR